MNLEAAASHPPFPFPCIQFPALFHISFNVNNTAEFPRIYLSYPCYSVLISQPYETPPFHNQAHTQLPLHLTTSSRAPGMMLFGLGNLFYVSILLVNAVAVLSEDRFLARIGWGNTPAEASFGGGRNDAASVKGKLVNLISSVRTLMRIPLIVINTLVIVYELVLG